MLLSLNNVSFAFGAHTLFDKVNWHIYENERIGLIGVNGAGKSSLFKILNGEFGTTGGNVNKSNEVRIGYFHQDLQSEDIEESILTVAMQAYDKALKLQEKLLEIEVKMQSGATDELIQKQADYLHEFEVAGGYEMEYKSAEVLEGLGFKTIDLQRPFKEFSGGWRMRVLLAKMILQNPEILLLDEPTNHLDLPSIEWIERYLSNYPGTIVIISHDRYFLDKMVTKIVEISNKSLHIYTGNYSQYESEKSVRAEFQLREYQNQQEFIKQQERFVERFKAKASKATQAQSIIKKLDRLERIAAPEEANKSIDFNFELGIQPGKIICEVNNMDKSYGPIHILKNASALIERGDKIALIGPNGKGKSTLLRIISGMESGQAGGHKLGHNVEPSFYAQHQLEALNTEHEILQELSSFGTKRSDLQLRQLLGCFLFQGDDVFKKIKVLSGGEKARVALAKTIIQEANFLLLDEPTNHLDMASVAALVDALNAYEGTFILVSHDRFFIQKTATVIWEIEDGTINVFKGNYDEWHEYKERKKQNKTEPVLIEKKVETVIAPPNTQHHREDRKEYKKLKNKFDRLEQEIALQEKNMQHIEAELADPNLYARPDDFKLKESAYLQLQTKIESLKKEYEEQFNKLLEYEN